MYILGMESSCDETSASVVEMGEGVRAIRSNIVASQIEVHRLYGGVVPEIASRAHIEAISSITEQALREAGITLSDVGAVRMFSFSSCWYWVSEISPPVPVDIIRTHFSRSHSLARTEPSGASEGHMEYCTRQAVFPLVR